MEMVTVTAVVTEHRTTDEANYQSYGGMMRRTFWRDALKIMMAGYHVGGSPTTPSSRRERIEWWY